MRANYFFNWAIALFAAIIIGCSLPINIDNQKAEANKDNTVIANITSQQGMLDNKYEEDITFCESNQDCIFHPGLCQAINKYYETEPMKPGDPACNLAICGTKCAFNKCEIDFSCLDNESDINCDDKCKSEGFIFGYCENGYDSKEGITEEDIKKAFNVKNVNLEDYKFKCDTFGIEDQKNIGKTIDCNYNDSGVDNLISTSNCCCIPKCIADGQPLNNVDASNCCSRQMHEYATACAVDPNTGDSSCFYTKICGE